MARAKEIYDYREMVYNLVGICTDVTSALFWVSPGLF